MISAGVAAYYGRLWGPPARTARFRTGEHAVHVYKWDRASHPEQVYFYATAGGSDYPLPGIAPAHRTEVYVGFTAEVDDIASPLAELALQHVLHGTRLGHGHSVTFPGPLWEGTEMDTALLVLPEPPVVPRYDDPSGTHVEFLQVMPLFPSEAAYRRVHGTAGLLDLWSAEDVPYWQPSRAAHPPDFPAPA